MNLSAKTCDSVCVCLFVCLSPGIPDPVMYSPNLLSAEAGALIRKARRRRRRCRRKESGEGAMSPLCFFSQVLKCHFFPAGFGSSCSPFREVPAAAGAAEESRETRRVDGCWRRGARMQPGRFCCWRPESSTESRHRQAGTMLPVGASKIKVKKKSKCN